MEEEIRRIAKSEVYKMLSKIFDFYVKPERRLDKSIKYALYSSKGLISTFDNEVEAYKEMLKLMSNINL